MDELTARFGAANANLLFSIYEETTAELMQRTSSPLDTDTRLAIVEAMIDEARSRGFDPDSLKRSALRCAIEVTNAMQRQADSDG